MISARPPALDIQGHRGARGLRPENTLPAFAHALSLGVTTLELDTGITRDGVVVVSHDPALNPDITRGPGGRWLESTGPAIRDLDYAALQRYDVGRIKPGSAYAGRFPEQHAADGARIPRLADLFALVARSGDTAVRFNIETKLSPLAPGETASPEEFASALVGAVRSAGLVERTTIQSFDWRTLHIVQRLAPEISTACLTAEQEFMDNVKSGAGSSPWTNGLHVSGFQNSIPRLVKAAGAAVWSPYYREVTAEKVTEAQALGLAVVVWTVNEPAEMQRMIELGVNGIISDYPDRLRRVAGDAGIALPRPSPFSP